MFKIDSDKTIHLTRGDIAAIELSLTNNNEQYTFNADDVVRFKVIERKDCNCVVLYKDAVLEAEAESVIINLDSNDTKIGEIINKPKDYWYEVEVNPDTAPQTVIGYDEDGAKIFRLYPEGSDINE